VLRLSHLLIVLPLTTVLGGCGPEGLDEQGAESSGQVGSTSGETPPSLDTVTQDLNVSNAGAWLSPNAATPLGATSNRVCYLTRIRGYFDGAGDYVRTFGSGGSWYVGGNGNTRAVADCAALGAGNAFTGEYDWTAGQRLPTYVGPAGDRVCFLTRVQGSFNSGSDWARVYVSGGSWFLFGNSVAGNGFARARCVTVSSYSPEYSWNQSQSYPTSMGSTAGRACGLTYMGGQFDSYSEYIDISAQAGSWYLGGASAHTGVAAKARCF
jgi:hypothetical protein